MSRLYKITDWASAAETARVAEVGDLIEFHRTLIHTHWGVFVGTADSLSDYQLGNGYEGSSSRHHYGDTPYVVHFDRKDDKYEKVRYDKISTVAKGEQCRVNNKYDDRENPFRRQQILDRAEEKFEEHLAGRMREYSLISWNCEHFASWCRNGRAMSDQSENGQTVAAVAVGGIAAVVGGIIYLANRSKEKDDSDDSNDEQNENSERRNRTSATNGDCTIT